MEMVAMACIELMNCEKERPGTLKMLQIHDDDHNHEHEHHKLRGKEFL